MHDVRDGWPDLSYAAWAPTQKTLHMYLQMLGKTRLALQPPLPEWLGASLVVGPLGFTTGSMPYGSQALELSIDLYAGSMRLTRSGGFVRDIPLASGRCVADVWVDLQAAFAECGVSVDIWEKPQELADVTPFSENRHDSTMDPPQAQAWHNVLLTTKSIFEEWRSPFFGRTAIPFWWGACDLAVLAFSGRSAEVPPGKGYIMRYDLDAQFMAAGFWPGNDEAPYPSFYAYLSPAPAGVEQSEVRPRAAGWVEQMGEWMLSYDAVRNSPDPRGALMEFLESAYEVAVGIGGWDRQAHQYVLPEPSKRGS